MRTRDRLIFILESLNESVVGSWTFHALTSAARYLRQGSAFNPVVVGNLAHIVNYDPSDHLRDLARDALALNEEAEEVP